MTTTPEPEPGRFSIDAVFFARELVARRIVREMQVVAPGRSRGARLVLELRAGEVERRGIELGDRLVRVEPT